MFSIENNNKAVVVQFNGDFNYSTIKQILYQEVLLPAFFTQNDLWLVDSHKANIHLGEIQDIVDDFSRLCPEDRLCNKRIGFVVAPGLTAAFLQLLANGLDRSLSLRCRVFEAIEDAEKWVGIKHRHLA